MGAFIALMNIETSIKQGVDGRCRMIKMPLYVKIMEFITRDFEYGRIAKEITVGCVNDEDKALAIFKWTRENIKRPPKGFHVFDDHILNIIIRGYGTGDQFQDVFATLCAYAELPAFFDKIYSNDKTKSLYLSFVKINGRWRVFDVYHGKYFRTKENEIASIEDISGDHSLVSGEDIENISATTGLPYKEFYYNLGSIEKKRTFRPEQQVPLKRILYEARRRLWPRDR